MLYKGVFMFNYVVFLFLFVSMALRASDDTPKISKKLAIAHVLVGDDKKGCIILKLSPALKSVDFLKSHQGAQLEHGAAEDLTFWSKYQEFHHIQLNRANDAIKISDDSVILQLSDQTVDYIKRLKTQSKKARAIHLVAPLHADEIVEPLFADETTEDKAVQHVLSSSSHPEQESPVRYALRSFFSVEF